MGCLVDVVLQAIVVISVVVVVSRATDDAPDVPEGILAALADTREHVGTGTGMLVSYDRDLSSNSVDSVLNVILPYLGLGGEIDANPGVVRERVSKVLGKRSNHASNGGVVPDWSPEEGGAVVGVSEEVRAASGLFMRESTEAMDDLASAS